MLRTVLRLPLLVWLGAVACGDRDVPAAELGERLFRDPKVSTSPFNAFACAHCHAADPTQPAVVPGKADSGYNLGNSVGRPSWWGGYEVRLLDAINVCVDRFMGGRKLRAEDAVARQLYAFLEERSPEPMSPAARLTIVRNVTDLAEVTGDAARGASLYNRACHRCHGGLHTGAGRLGPLSTTIPESVLETFPADKLRAVVVEKIRHGRFFNIGGVMPFYSAETMTDAEVADILAYMVP